MKFLFLTDEGPGNAWLIQEVEREVAIQTIIRPDWSSAPPAKPGSMSLAARLFQSPFKRLARRARKRYFARLDGRNGYRLEKELFPASPMPTPASKVVSVPWWTVNGVEMCDRIRAFAPDLMVVCGAPLLKPAVFNIPRLGTVNLHFGISPDYRGQHTLFWPLRRGDYAHIGATLHYINEGIDSGPVLFRIYPALEPADDIVSIEAKIVRLAARTVREFLKSLAANPPVEPVPGKRFTEKGRLIRDGDRTISDDVFYRLKRLAGSRVPSLPERVERFYLGE